MALVGAALGASALFGLSALRPFVRRNIEGYNRESFEFDKKQTLLSAWALRPRPSSQGERLRLRLQLKRFGLFRDDVRDLVTLTVDRARAEPRWRVAVRHGRVPLDWRALHEVLHHRACGQVFGWLSEVFCKGRIQASAPPFLLQLFQCHVWRV